jgi:hypothetical protein
MGHRVVNVFVSFGEVQPNAQPHDELFPASAPIPKFASLCGTLSCELRNQRSTSKYMFLVRFWI